MGCNTSKTINDCERGLCSEYDYKCLGISSRDQLIYNNNPINQGGVIDVAASMPVTISGNLIVTIITISIAIILLIAYLWRKNRFGRSSQAQRLSEFRKHHAKLRDQRLMESQLAISYDNSADNNTRSDDLV